MKILSLSLIKLLLLLACLWFPHDIRGTEPSNDTIFVGIIVKDYDQLMPFFLKSIDNLDYNKKQLQIQFNNSNSNPHIQKLLEEWAEKNKNAYKNIACVNNADLFSSKESVVDKNKIFGEIKDSYLAKSKELNSAYCFILSSDVFILPSILKQLIKKNKPIISPLLRPIPEVEDPFRNFFLDITENGYYKDHADYYAISNRLKLGTFKVPCVSYVYLIQPSAYNKLSFTNHFIDWEFLSFSKSARENTIDQYLCNEKEFGFFLHFNKEMTKEEERAFSLVGMEYEVTPALLKDLLSSYYAEDSYLKQYAENFNFNDYAIYRVQNKDLYYVDDVNDYIKTYVIKQGKNWEEHFHPQFKKYATPGSTVLDIGGHIGTHTLYLSKIVGELGKVHVFEPQAKLFCELAVNMHLNQCKNVVMHHNALGSEEKWIEIYIPKESWTEFYGGVLNEGHGTVTDSSSNHTGDKAKMVKLDDLKLDHISFIKMDVEGLEMEVIRGGKETIKRHKPVMIIEIFQNAETVDKIKEIESLGYVHTLFNLDNYFFFPLEMLNHNSLAPSEKQVVEPSQKTLKEPIKVAWEGSFLDFGSLSNVNRAITEEVAKHPKINLTRVSSDKLDPKAARQPEILNTAMQITAQSPPGTQVTIRHAWPPNWQSPSEGKWVLIQPWEYGIIPEEWVEKSKNVDEIWVPTTFVKKEFVNSDVPADKVKVVPNGYDPKKFHPQIEPYQLATNKKFKFLFVGGTIYRKGADCLLNSYLKSFTAADDVCLVVKDFGSKSCYAALTHENAFKEAQAAPNSPEIIYLDEDMSSEKLASLYKACDCLVYPYRGEGFALPVLEAMACGLAVVVTAGGATDDFVTHDCGWFIPAAVQSIGYQVGSMKLKKEGWFLEPNAEVLSAMLQWISQHPADVAIKGKAASEQAKEWTWEKAAAIVATRLEALSTSE